MAGFSGKWDMVTKSPMGAQSSTLDLQESGGSITGSTTSPMVGTLTLENGKASGRSATWTVKMTVPMPLTLDAQVTLDSDDTFAGTVKAGAFGSWPVTGKRAS
ncbi:MAG: hypothetical protein JSR36_02680 [Proteobacteria bacterium]|nr:hypothetical protein [Pseudomonadota bacterium]